MYLPRLSMYVRTYQNSIMKCTTTMISYLPRYHGEFFCKYYTRLDYLFGTKYDANLEIMSCHQVLSYQPLHTHVHQDPNNNWRGPFKIHFFARFLACLAQYPSAFTSRCRTDKAGRGALEPPPEDGARTKLFNRDIPVPSIPY